VVDLAIDVVLLPLGSLWIPDTLNKWVVGETLGKVASHTTSETWSMVLISWGLGILVCRNYGVRCLLEGRVRWLLHIRAWSRLVWLLHVRAWSRLVWLLHLEVRSLHLEIGLLHLEMLLLLLRWH
jgi:hypothetical protein